MSKLDPDWIRSLPPEHALAWLKRQRTEAWMMHREGRLGFVEAHRIHLRTLELARAVHARKRMH